MTRQAYRKGNGSSSAVAPSQVVTKTTTYTAAAGDFVLAGAGAGAFTVTLPAAASGRMVRVKKTDNSANAVTVVPASGTIDNAASQVLTAQFQSLDFVSDGTNWFVV